MSVTVLLLMLSLFHHDSITSSATCTTASLPFKSPCHQDSQVFKVSNSNLQFPRPSATYRFPRNRKPSESNSQAFLFQDLLQLSVPPGLASLQSIRDKLFHFKFSCNPPCPQFPQASRFYYKALRVGENQLFFANNWPKLQMKIHSRRKLPRPMHLKISGFLYPYF